MKQAFYIQKKLERGVLPYLICSENLDKTVQYRIYKSYTYGKEVVPIASSIGISSPLFNIINAEPVQMQGITIAGILGLVVGLFLRIFGGRDEIIKKMIGQDRIRNQFKGIRHELNEVMEGDPDQVLQKVIVVQQKISNLINTALQEEVWPFNPYSKKSEEQAKIEAEGIVTNLIAAWGHDQVDTASINETPEQRIP